MATILIVDDDRLNCQQVRKLLSTYGYSSGFLSRPEFLFRRLEEDPIDLILLDVNMPGIDGLTLLKQIRGNATYDNIPIIMLTGEDSDQLLVDCFEYGATDYIIKPIRELVLKARIKSALTAKFEQERSRRLLENFLPKKIAEELLVHGKTEPRYHSNVTVVFTDFFGYTQVPSEHGAELLVRELGTFFDHFDDVIEKYRLERLKTIGDGYMYAGGISEESPTHVLDCVLAALEIRSLTKRVQQARMQEKKDEVWELRIGMDTGPVMAGVIGKLKFSYDVWGDTVNTASRMESECVPGELTISDQARNCIAEFFDCEVCGDLKVKGRGVINMHLVRGLLPEFQDARNPETPNSAFYKKYESLKL